MRRPHRSRPSASGAVEAMLAGPANRFDDDDDAEGESDPKALAKRVTDPLLEEFRRGLDKVDLSRFKQEGVGDPWRDEPAPR